MGSKISAVLLVFFLLASFPARIEGQNQRIVVLKSANLAPYNAAVKGIQGALGDLPVYDLQGGLEDRKALVHQIVSNGAGVIIAVGAPAASVAVQEQSGVPVVFAMVLYSEKKMVEGGNVTGVYMDVSTKAQFTLLKQVFPKLSSVGVIYDPSKTGDQVALAEGAAKALNIRLVPASVSSPQEVPQALRGLLPQIDALWMVPDSTVITADSFDYINETMFENRLPFLVFSKEFVEAGALFALSPNYEAIGRQTAALVLRILRGVSAGSIPAHFPDKYQLVVNIKTAQQLGVKFPASVMAEAKIVE